MPDYCKFCDVELPNHGERCILFDRKKWNPVPGVLGVPMPQISDEDIKKLTRHTPGPWEARIDKYGIDVINSKSGFGVVVFGTKNELKDAEYPLDEAEANALLIAAAPELLSEVIRLREEKGIAVEGFNKIYNYSAAESCVKLIHEIKSIASNTLDKIK